MDSSVELPIPYYLCVAAVLFLLWKGWQARDEAWGIPMMVTLATVGAWYLGDPLYNGYEGYVRTLGADHLSAAWWEVLLFLIALGVMSPKMHHRLNRGLPVQQSQILEAMRTERIDTVEFQDQVEKLARALALGWGILMLIALSRTNFDMIGLFFPFLGEKSQPWGRDRIGAGIDALFALAGYVQIMLTALLGVCFALAKRPSVFTLSGACYLLALPFYLFDRTRNAMLAVLLPGFMALLTLRLRGGIVVRLAVAVVGFMALEGWMKFVIDNRDQMSMAQAMKTGGTQDVAVKARKHLGFNMYEELGYINYFTDNGTYKPNWGSRYFAEIVNPVPRVLWPGKPLIGIDYAIARGMAYANLDAKGGGVAASISTGMIGQGVVNFGRILGPIAAAFLMAIWVAVLARQDLMGRDLGHLLLYAIGLVLTFNMGRDITLLVIYPFVFGWILLNFMNRNKAPIATITHAA